MKIDEVWVAGEALIDLVTRGDSVTPVVGGGPANTAKALARLGVKVKFIGGISSDEFGIEIAEELQKCGVDLSLAMRSELRTAVAKAQIEDSGTANYEFQLDDSATFDFKSGWLPIGTPKILHIGSVATILEPGASELFEWAQKASQILVFDPNVRPAIQSDRNFYRTAIERWINISSIVKLSEDDLSWLYSESEDEVVKRWLASGVSLVVVTLGAAGLRAYGNGFVLNAPAASIKLVDTVGAGDTIGAVLVEGLLMHGLEGLLNESVLQGVLNRAVKAAGITCSRAGANPPWKDEL